MADDPDAAPRSSSDPASPAGRAGGAPPLRFLLDADLRPTIAVVARGLGLDMASAHELKFGDLPDDEVLRFAAREGRVTVTRNRDDFVEWTTVFLQRGDPHAGVLIVPTHLSIQRPERVAHALLRWADAVQARLGGAAPSPYLLDWLHE
ncbi:hypothetical protein tb265_50210 [Gemmatimonadetes bacterium T265]|nr:hypothetical protein tb265_50210 [Gemmatimonadetes bacterium T265]